MHIENHTFLVTGGASGLGAACACMIVGSGGNAVIADVNAEAGQTLAGALGDRARFAPADVTDEASIRSAIALATTTFGALHGTINCAGVAIAELLLRKGQPHALASFARVVEVNLTGTFNVCRLAAAAMADNAPNVEGERGVIINTASIAAFEGQIGQIAYSASKGGVAAMTLPMARELARYGIRVVAIAPGIFDTPLLAGLPEPARQSLAQQVPFPPRLGRPDEYAMLAKHIIENAMLNGEVIRLDGAMRMAPK
ncbi:MAG: 3-hydroxyacyl-CoA dehydrogenase [Anaerolineae bacterium]|jgi:NAD(P)-dependent dehydrogenase (short-subunit alcohol dehydrogenase family)|nr:3-hydroxyacyl-CoA dehydrogenase [Anaerolineae bacterium]